MEVFAGDIAAKTRDVDQECLFEIVCNWVYTHQKLFFQQYSRSFAL